MRHCPPAGYGCVPSHFIGTLIGTMDRWHLSNPWIESTTGQKSAMLTISSTCSQYPWHLATCAALRQWEGPGSLASPASIQVVKGAVGAVCISPSLYLYIRNCIHTYTLHIIYIYNMHMYVNMYIIYMYILFQEYHHHRRRHLPFLASPRASCRPCRENCSTPRSIHPCIWSLPSAWAQGGPVWL